MRPRRQPTSPGRSSRCGRTLPAHSPALAVLLVAGLTLGAQQISRDAYRNAYRVWRQADPNLERDAGGPEGSALSSRTTAAAAAAASYDAARGTFLSTEADTQGQDVLWLQNASPKPLPEPAPAADYLRFVQNQTAAVNANITTFSNDQDPGLQQLRRSLERERDALAALRTAIQDRVKAVAKVEDASSAVEKDRTAALAEYEPVLTALKQQTASISKEAEAWKSYYLKLGEGARGASEAATQVSSATLPATPPAPEPASANPAPTSGAAPGANLPQPAEASVSPPKPLLPSLRTASITPLPLARYIGGWTYPIVNGLFHGPEPQSVDLEVQENQGHVTGAFTARFKLPPGNKQDPVLRFNFSGDLQPTRHQVFNLTTSDGTKGTVELIPGNAFNLLEVNFQTEPKPGKIRFGDLLLVKK